MGYFKFLNKIFPASPDAILKKAPESEAALARMAHVNCIVNDLSDIAKYDLDLTMSMILPVNTNKGIIDITGLYDIGTPDPAFDSNKIILLTNSPVLNLANKENLYIQLTPYYSPASGDLFVPYVITTGAIDGLNITIYNANPAPDTGTNGQGAFYLYYEIKSIA